MKNCSTQEFTVTELGLLNNAIFIPPQEKNWITIWKQRSCWIGMQHPMKSSLYIASILKILPSEFWNIALAWTLQQMKIWLVFFEAYGSNE
jgi:hypothetical protein